jgi:hypothetical protein
MQNAEYFNFPSQTWRFEQITWNYLAKAFLEFLDIDSLAIQHNAEDKRNNQYGQIEYRMRNILPDSRHRRNPECECEIYC